MCKNGRLSEKSARVQASKFLNGTDFPEVVELIKELRQAAERKYGVTLMHQLKRLDELSRGAEEAGQYSAAINAEKIRSALGGLTIDRREQQHIHQLDNMSKQDIVARLAELRKSYPHAFIEGKYLMPKPLNTEKKLWLSLKKTLPKKTHCQRIENRVSEGMPDCYLCIDGVPVWVELKITKNNANPRYNPHRLRGIYRIPAVVAFFFLAYSPSESDCFYLTGVLQPRSKVRGSMTCDLRPYSLVI